MNLADAKTGEEYFVKDIVSITVSSHIKGGCVVSIKDARYNMDTDLAKAISI